MMVTQSIKGKPKYQNFGSGCILFGYTIRSNERDTWICIVPFKCSFTWALCSDYNPEHTSLSWDPMFLFFFNSKKLKRRLSMAQLLFRKIILYTSQFTIICHGHIKITSQKGTINSHPPDGGQSRLNSTASVKDELRCTFIEAQSFPLFQNNTGQAFIS